MGAKGSVAKENVVKKIAQAFGDDFVGEFDKKLYVWSDDGGSRVQVCLALTCPKVYRGVEETSSPEMNFDDDDGAPAAASTFVPADITQKEQDDLAALMERLNL